MKQNLVAGSIGATFGLVFVMVNVGAPLDAALSDALRAVAVAAFVVVAIMLARLRRRGGAASAHTMQPERNLFRRRYWAIVAAEVALLVAGRVVIVAVGAPQQAFVAWIAFVVGVHFLAFAAFRVWNAGVRTSGWILAALGLLGLVLAATPARPWVPLVSGALSGATLLAGTLSWIARDLAQVGSSRAAGVRGEQA